MVTLFEDYHLNCEIYRPLVSASVKGSKMAIYVSGQYIKCLEETVISTPHIFEET